MAYLDDNNDNLYKSGDPLEELDSELADLKAKLGALEADNIGQAPDIPEKTEAPKPDIPTPDKKEEVTAEDKKPEIQEEVMKKQTNKPAHMSSSGGKKPRKTSTILVIIIAAVLVIAIAAGSAFILPKLFAPKNDGDTVATSGGEKVTINDSVMGDIELDTVKGAEINTYKKENLVTDDNGYYAYYENGKKISHLGIDLSEFQGNVDFDKVKAAGVEFVMLRIGGQYYGDEGGMYEDTLFNTYYEQAKAAGLKVGAYFFSQAASTEDAKQEAEYSISKLSGKKLDYPIAFDWENIEDDKARTDNISGDQLTAIAEAFCDTVINAGYKAIVYSNTSQMFVMYDFETMKDYDFWLADYRDFPTMYYNFDMWQYATDGKVDGIEGQVDLNLSFTDFTDQ